MPTISAKSILHKALGHLNVGATFRRMAHSPFRRNHVFFIFEGQSYTYAQTYASAVKYAKLFLELKKEGGGNESPAVGIYMENTPEFVFAFFGAALSGTVLFCYNTGFRGETLAKVIRQSEVGLLLVDENTGREVRRVETEINADTPIPIYMAGEGDTRTADAPFRRIKDVLSSMETVSRIKAKVGLFDPLIVIYTSGTTGLPKGIPCSHAKCLGAGLLTRLRIGLKSRDRGYICMPLFHSNAILLALMPLVRVGGSFLLKRKFSASAFEEDVLFQGVTYMNYVGQPLHYILSALEKKYGDGEAVTAALAGHPQNRFRIAHGNGAPPVDRQKLIRYLGMTHIYELYGSTEAPITTVLKPGDPPDSLGSVGSKKIVILNETDDICPPGIADADGNLLNYDQAVGEICRKMAADNVFFDGYFKDSGATHKKLRDGYFHSGDLGHIRIVNGKRYLYFNGRTDDWIRKDGENFSAENAAGFAVKLPRVRHAVAYGVPCHIADERVMAAVSFANGKVFDPQEAFDWFMSQQREGGMNPKWMPDYIRIMKEFPMTPTHKILIRPLKQEHFHLERHPDMEIYYFDRGDTTYRRLTPEAFREIKDNFRKTGRLHLLEGP